MHKEKQKTGKKVGKGNPPKEHQFKEGYDSRRGHRKKGTPNRSTFIKKILESKIVPPDQILRNLRAMYPQYFKKKGNIFETRLVLVIRLIQKAIIKGDSKTAQLLLDYAYGKEPDKLEGEIEIGELNKKIKNILEK